MRLKLPTACAVVLASGSCGLAQPVRPFSINLASAGGPSGLGAPIAVTGGTIFQHPNGSNFPPDPSLFVDFPSLEFDSYVALDPKGPARVGAPSNAPTQFVGPGFDQVSLGGDWSSDNGVPSSRGPFPGLESVFIARLSITAGASLVMPLLGAEVVDETSPTPILLQGLPLRQGIQAPSPSRGGSAYDFRSISQTVSFPAPITGGFGNRATITLEVIDIYLVRVPTPGVASLALIGSVGLLRRTRR